MQVDGEENLLVPNNSMEAILLDLDFHKPRKRPKTVVEKRQEKL